MNLRYNSKSGSPVALGSARPPPKRDENGNHKNLKNSWENEKKTIFKNSFDINQIKVVISELHDLQDKTVMQKHIESITEKIHRIYKDAGCDSGVMTVFNKFSSGRIKKTESQLALV